MKDKVKIVALVLFLTIFITGCNGNITRSIRHAGFSVGGKFICDGFMPVDKEDTGYKKIRYFTGPQLIDETGKIYEVSLDKTYANGQNCKMADTMIVVKAIFDNRVIKGDDDKYYYLLPQNNVPSYTQIPQTDNSYIIYDLLLKDSDIVKVTTANSSTGLYYVLKTDGNVYAYLITQEDRNSLPKVSSISVVYNKYDYGSTIVDYNYAGDSVSTFIKTEDQMFRMKITNSDQCLKYADVACNFKIHQDEMFDKNKEYIITYNGNTLITTYGQVFTINS